jgi:hypothetical protein
MTQAEIERTERLIAATDLLSARLNRAIDTLDKIADALERPSPGWRRMLDEFKGAVSRIPTTIRTRF